MSAVTSWTWTWSTTHSDAFFEHKTLVRKSVAEGTVRKRIIAVDLEHQELVVVDEEAYARRDFRALERVAFSDALPYE